MLLDDSEPAGAACRFEAFDLEHLQQLTHALRDARATGRYADVLALARRGTPPALTPSERASLVRSLGRLRDIEAPRAITARFELELERLDFLQRACEASSTDLRHWDRVLPMFALRMRVDWRERERIPALWLVQSAQDGSAMDALRLVFGAERFIVAGEEPIGPREGDLIARLGSNYTSPGQLLAANQGLERLALREVDDLHAVWSTSAAAMRPGAETFTTAMQRGRRALARLIRMRKTAARRGLGVFASDGFGDAADGPQSHG